MSIVPNAPVTVTEATLKASLKLDDPAAAEVLRLAVVTVNRELTGAFRDVPVEVYDDMVRRVCGAIVADRRRPAGGGGQLTRTDQPAAPATTAAPRDYATPIRPTLALYVAPL